MGTVSMTKDSTPLEGSSFTRGQVRLLKISIAIMTALLILGILALVYGMARQASRLGTAGTPQQAFAGPYVQSLALGQGDLKEVTSANGLIILHWKGDTNDLILTLDAVTGHELGRIQVPHR